MGILRPCYSVSGESVEIAVIALYDRGTAREDDAFDDVMGQPFRPDTDADGLGERERPEIVHELPCKFRAARWEEQVQDGAGNAPEGLVFVTLYEYSLTAAGLLVDGVCGVRANDRLLRVKKNDEAGSVRAEFAHAGRQGLYCIEVRPGETGDGTWLALFEIRRQAV